jgi:hypothetical protein
MDTTQTSSSQLFMLRVWVEDVGDGRFEIRGQAKHVPSSETAYFRKWSTLQAFLTRRLAPKEAVDTNG